MKTQFLVGCGATLAVVTAVCSGAFGASPIVINAWDGNSGYVQGRPYIGAGGVVYGVLGYSPSNGDQNGIVYALTPPTSGSTYTQTTIATFSGGASGGTPTGGLVADSSGNLYGAAYSGGSAAAACLSSGLNGCGVVFELLKPATGSTWQVNILHTFTGGTDGLAPLGSLVADSSGNLYGVTQGGGCTPTLTYPIGCGTVFKLVNTGSSYIYKQIYAFQGGGTNDGAYPAGPLTVDAAENVFGVTEFGGGGASGCNSFNGSPDGLCGVVFKLSKAGGSYTETILHYFSDATDGSLPAAGVVMDRKGNLFGTTLQGGTDSGLCLNFGYSGCGQVFELVRPISGGTWTKKTVVNFSGTDGATPTGLLIDHRGNLFGETSLNTTADTRCLVSYYCGTVFRMTKSHGKWSETVLNYFTGSGSFAGGQFGLAANPVGTLFGLTEYNVTSTAFTITGGFVP